MGKLTQDRLLLAALLCSVVGVVSLYIISQNIEPKIIHIKEISRENLGEHVVVEGIVCRLYESKGNTFLTLCDGGEIEAPVFGSKIDVEIGDSVSISGTVSEYKERLQIQPDGVEDISIKEVLWGRCRDGKIEAKGYSSKIQETYEGPCGLLKEEGRIIKPTVSEKEDVV